MIANECILGWKKGLPSFLALLDGSLVGKELTSRRSPPFGRVNGFSGVLWLLPKWGFRRELWQKVRRVCLPALAPGGDQMLWISALRLAGACCMPLRPSSGQRGCSEGPKHEHERDFTIKSKHFMPTQGKGAQQNKAERIIARELVAWGGNTSSTVILLVHNYYVATNCRHSKYLATITKGHARPYFINCWI